MRNLLCLCTLLTVVLLCDALRALPTSRDILRHADEARGNLDGITWEVVLESPQEKRSQTMAFDVKARGFDILAQNLAPPKSQGNKLLMLNSNMWFYKPGLSKPVPISQRQKLLGQAAYGDIASTNYAEDYEATLLGEEQVNGEVCHVFDLISKNDKTTYDRIKYWISKDRHIGVKAEYFTVSGKLFKSASMEYANMVNINGEKRPFISRIIIQDELVDRNMTILTLNDPHFQELPNHIFNLNLLMR